MTGSKDNRPGTELMEVWLMNPFPDVALQLLGHRILAEAFKLKPELLDKDKYIELPMDGSTYDWGKFDPEQFAVGSCTIRISINVFTDEHELIKAGIDVSTVLLDILASTGIIRGTVRLHVTPDTIRAGWLIATIIWMGRKLDDRQ
jgi:hypothetical protein